MNLLRAEKGEDSIEMGVAMKYLKAARYDANKAMDIYKNYQVSLVVHVSIRDMHTSCEHN